MKEHFWTKISIFFTLRICLGLILLLYSPFLAQGQTYKMYYKNTFEENPQSFTVKDMVYNPLNNSIVVGGEYRNDSLSTTAQGYVLETNFSGLEIKNHALISPTFNSRDGFRMGGIALDALDRPYIAGSYATSMSNPSSLTEKTISGMDFDGKLRWSQMEGSNHFADITYDPDDNSLIALGAPDGVWQSSKPISLLKMNVNGGLIAYKSVFVPTITEAIKVVDLPNNKGYLVAAIYDTAGLKAPFVLHFDTNLNRTWSFIYTDFLHEYEVSDLAYHPNGRIGIAGTSYDPISDKHRAFLIGLNDEGQITHSQQFEIMGQGGLEVFGITHVEDDLDPVYNGFILGGAFEPSSGTASRHALVFHINLDGKIAWAKDFSNFIPQDFVEDETAKRVIYLPNTNMFAVAGESKIILHNAMHKQHIWVAKANTRDGYLQDGGSCSNAITLDVGFDSLGIYKVGTDTTGGGLMNFSYPTSSLNFSRSNCSFSYEEGPQRISTSNTERELSEKNLAKAIEVFDLTGRLVLKSDLRNPHWREGMNPGIYLINYLNNKKILFSEKMVLP